MNPTGGIPCPSRRFRLEGVGDGSAGGSLVVVVTPVADDAPSANVKCAPGGRVRPGAVGFLHLNGDPVGLVTVTGWGTSWGFGRFRPGARFEPYAQVYGLWSLLMHDNEDGRPLTAAASAELARVENALDRIRGRLYFPTDDVWVDLFQLNIDGELLEWKEY